MADLKPHILSNAIDWVYAAFFYSDYTQQLCYLPDAFASELTHEDEGYASGS